MLFLGISPAQVHADPNPVEGKDHLSTEHITDVLCGLNAGSSVLPFVGSSGAGFPLQESYPDLFPISSSTGPAWRSWQEGQDG